MRPRAATRGRVLATAALGALMALAFLPQAALAHGDMDGHPSEGQTQEPGMRMGGGPGEREAGQPMTVQLEVRVPEEADLGDAIRVQAVLTDGHGDAIEGATVVFEADAFWGEEIQGHMVIGSAVTNHSGVATLVTRLRTSGEFEVAASFPGDGRHAPAMEERTLDVHGDQQLYSPTAGIRIPWLNLWVLAGVIGLVWSVYFLVGLRVLAIARPPRPPVQETLAGVRDGTTRREFLARVLPLGAQAGVAAAGAGLVTIVARSPRTHGNLMAPPSTVDYHRTPIAHVGQMMEMHEMPAPLDREVSFSNEVLPIFMANGGPHVVAPEHSPPPGGLRLDSYEGVMAKEGVVVPGKPQESELVEHLLSVGMQMPPSLPPLPDEQIRLIVTWIAQGARNN